MCGARLVALVLKVNLVVLHELGEWGSHGLTGVGDVHKVRVDSVLGPVLSLCSLCKMPREYHGQSPLSVGLQIPESCL